MKKLTKKEKLEKLGRAIVEDVILKGYGDFFKRDYNTSYTIDIGLTIEEIRLAAELIDYHPSKKDKNDIKEKIEWREYIEELDS